MNAADSRVGLGSMADPALGDLVDEIAARVQAGEAVDVEAVIRDHPEHAEALRRFVPAIEVLAGLGQSVAAGGVSFPPTAADGDLERQRLGDFRIVPEVGRGGMGIVYEAEQVSLGRRVALKVLPFAATIDPKQLQRFHNEAKAAACLHHEHIIPVYFVGCERSVHFYAMQFIDGRTLAQIIHALQPNDGPAEADANATRDYRPAGDAPTAPVAALSTERSGPRGREFYRQAAELIAQAAEALEHAHSLGIVHRDIKPANLLIGPGGKLWVGDFGLARLGADAGLTMSGDLLGTLRYMAPEQALARHGLVDHRVDVYALGATLYELLTLRPAVTGAERAEVLRQISFEEPAAPRKLDKGIPEELETIAVKALAKSPGERYATAQELADDLRRFLEDKPIRARRPTLVQRAAKWSRRHRAVVAAAVVGLVAALAVLGGSVGWVLRDHAARRDEAGRRARESLAETRKAIDDKRDLPLARQLVAEAQGRLGTESASLPDLAADIDRAGDEIAARQADENRFQQFLKLASDAQDMMGGWADIGGHRMAGEALDQYSVLTDNEWLSRVKKSYLTADQKQQVRETAYFTLVSLACFEVRWERTYHPVSAPRSLDLLRRAQAFHEPTRAFYYPGTEETHVGRLS